MSIKNPKRKKDPRLAQYLADARALESRFPNMKKYRRRKTLKPGEKSWITRALRIAEAKLLPKDQQPEALRKYKFPSERIKTDEWYKDQIREALERAPQFAKILKHYLRQRTKLKPGQKAYIMRVIRQFRFEQDLYTFPKSDLRKIPQEVKDSGAIKKDIRAIKLRDTLADARVSVDQYGDIIVETGRGAGELEYIYRYTGEEPDALEQAAFAAFERGAKQVWFWTVHGKAGDYATSMKTFMIMLRSQYMEYLKRNVKRGYFDESEDQNWLLGISILYG